jgi:antitoxin component YwqK of YwqJK toxin-antitoxin module
VRSPSDSRGEARTARFTEWYPSGRRRAEGSYRVESDARGERHVREGTWTFFDESGARTATTELRGGVRHGEHTEWYPSGRKRSYRTYIDGRPVGRQARWHENGQRAWQRDELRTEDGHVLWFEQTWGERGELSSEQQHRDGEPHGRAVRRFANGALREEGAYYAGRKHGAWVYWSANGERIRTEMWSHGARVAE